MPMSSSYKQSLFPILPDIMDKFRPCLVGDYAPDVPLLDRALSPGAHIYDEKGIRETISLMLKLFFTAHPGTNFFAVKACPNIEILKIMLDMGFGLDCSSPTEIVRALKAGAKSGQIMFTSNNTNPLFYQLALDSGAILNLDDITFLNKVPEIPKRICFRYNPGNRRTEGSNKIIGNPVNQKYGLRHDQIVEAYRIARDKGAEIFGLHTMFASNSLDPYVLAGNVKMQLEIAEMIQDALGIKLEFINIGGGLGTNYRPEETPLDIYLMAEITNNELADFKAKRGYLPHLYIESGRYVTGPHGVLVASIINIMDKYKKFLGIDICDACDILRAGIYPAYHEISIVTPQGKERSFNDGSEIASIVGPLCENIHMVSDRKLPIAFEKDLVVVHNTGAHGIAMAMPYNGWCPSQELLFRPDNTVVRIARAGTMRDLLAREEGFTF